MAVRNRRQSAAQAAALLGGAPFSSMGQDDSPENGESPDREGGAVGDSPGPIEVNGADSGGAGDAGVGAVDDSPVGDSPDLRSAWILRKGQRHRHSGP